MQVNIGELSNHFLLLIRHDSGSVNQKFERLFFKEKVNPRDSGCKPYTPCPAGWYTAVGFDEQAVTPVCKPCPSGYFKADASSANGETENWEDVCTPRSRCLPGTYTSGPVAESRTEDLEPTCTNCPDGKYRSRPSSPYDTNECVLHRPCQPGTYVVDLGDSVSNTICAACPTGEYSDSEWADACTPYSVCPEGENTVNAWSKTNDLTCTACGEGTFNDNGLPLPTSGTFLPVNSTGPCPQKTPAPVSDVCTPWTPCGSGEYVSVMGNTTTDVQCSLCPTGTYWPRTNPSHFSLECIKMTPCPPGKAQQNDASGLGNTIPPQCADCRGDSYKPSTSSSVTKVGSHIDGASPDSCKFQPRCPAGTYTPNAKDSIQGTVRVEANECVPCSAGQYQDAPLPQTITSSCHPILPCKAGTFTFTIGTAQAKAQCTACSDTSYKPNASLSITDTETGCPEPHRAPCEAGAYTSTAANAARASTCTSCPSGSSANAWDVAAQSASTSEICMPHTPCPSGTYTSKAGSATEDTTCTNCPSGSFKPFASASTTETDSCHAWVPKPGCCREISSEIDVNGDSVDVSSAADANTVSVQTFPAVPGAAAETKCEIACENDETCTAVEVDLTSDKAAATCEFHTGTINAATRAG
eukprot:gene22368-4169_t